MTWTAKRIKSRYVNPKILPHTMSNALVKRSIVECVKKYQSRLTGRLLDVGCGFSPYKSLLKAIDNYTGLDIKGNHYIIAEEEKDKDKVFFDGKTIPFEPQQFDSILCTEVLEHVFEPQDFINEIYRVLKGDGCVLLTTPFLWPLHDEPYDFYRYTRYALKELFEHAGFSEITILVRGGWYTNFSLMLGGCFTRCFPKYKYLRYMLMLLGYPLVYVTQIILPKFDRHLESETLPVGYTVFAKKPQYSSK
ncbi:MAG: class I SAM-dependent methyltransferase [Phycisphaerae bacterium]